MKTRIVYWHRTSSREFGDRSGTDFVGSSIAMGDFFSLFFNSSSDPIDSLCATVNACIAVHASDTIHGLWMVMMGTHSSLLDKRGNPWSRKPFGTSNPTTNPFTRSGKWQSMSASPTNRSGSGSRARLGCRCNPSFHSSASGRHRNGTENPTRNCTPWRRMWDLSMMPHFGGSGNGIWVRVLARHATRCRTNRPWLCRSMNGPQPTERIAPQSTTNADRSSSTRCFSGISALIRFRSVRRSGWGRGGRKWETGKRGSEESK